MVFQANPNRNTRPVLEAIAKNVTAESRIFAKPELLTKWLRAQENVTRRGNDQDNALELLRKDQVLSGMTRTELFDSIWDGFQVPCSLDPASNRSIEVQDVVFAPLHTVVNLQMK